MTRACSAILLLAALALACRPDRGGSAESGVMSITHAAVPALVIPPGGPVRLAPGSFTEAVEEASPPHH